MTNDNPRAPDAPRSGYTTIPKLLHPTREQLLEVMLTATNHIWYALSLINALLPDDHGLDTTVDLRTPNPKPQPTTPQEPTL